MSKTRPLRKFRRSQLISRGVDNMLKTFMFESIGDDSSAIYQWNGKKYLLVAILNEESSLRFNHPWPSCADKKTAKRWMGRCPIHPVKWVEETGKESCLEKKKAGRRRCSKVQEC